MSQVIIILWILLLIVAVVAIPVLVTLLHRTWLAARSIERYFADMRDAGLGIADHTSHIKVLEDTISVASDMLDTAVDTDRHAATIEETLAARAKDSTNPAKDAS